MTVLRTVPALVLAVAATAATAATDEDALDLQAAAAAPAAVKAGSLRLTLELAAIHGSRTGGQGSDSGHRASLDLRWSDRLTDAWRFGLSNRLDDLHPALPGQRNTRNQLREAYVSWQAPSGNQSLDIGRLNLRHGPAYGFNPTDVFREGASRWTVTADPIALRENRTGTFMLRGSQLWDGGSAAIAWAPQLSQQPVSDKTWTLDLAATNARHRLLLTTNAKASDRWGGEALALLEQGRRPLLGANLTGLLNDATVLHGEWAVRREPSLLDAALGRTDRPAYQHRLSAGATLAVTSGLSVTAEASYNGAGLDRADWRQLFAQGPLQAGRMLQGARASQEQASRKAWLLYATQKGVIAKKLDITAFYRQNLDDRSGLAWVEARYRWDRMDLALQWQRGSDRQVTEFGALPYRQLIQVVGSASF